MAAIAVSPAMTTSPVPTSGPLSKTPAIIVKTSDRHPCQPWSANWCFDWRVSRDGFAARPASRLLFSNR